MSRCSPEKEVGDIRGGEDRNSTEEKRKTAGRQSIRQSVIEQLSTSCVPHPAGATSGKMDEALLWWDGHEQLTKQSKGNPLDSGKGSDYEKTVFSSQAGEELHQRGAL